MRTIQLISLIVLLSVVSLSSYAQNPDKAEQYAEKEITISLEAPNPCYSIRIKSIYTTLDETFVLAVIKPDSADACIQIIAAISDTVKVNNAAEKVTFYIIGKTWDWGNKDNFVLIDNENIFLKAVEGAEKITIYGQTQITVEEKRKGLPLIKE